MHPTTWRHSFTCIKPTAAPELTKEEWPPGNNGAPLPVGHRAAKSTLSGDYNVFTDQARQFTFVGDPEFDPLKQAFCLSGRFNTSRGWPFSAHQHSRMRSIMSVTFDISTGFVSSIRCICPSYPNVGRAYGCRRTEGNALYIRIALCCGVENPRIVKWP
jgi:hypothetical protein